METQAARLDAERVLNTYGDQLFRLAVLLLGLLRHGAEPPELYRRFSHHCPDGGDFRLRRRCAAPR